MNRAVIMFLRAALIKVLNGDSWNFDLSTKREFSALDARLQQLPESSLCFVSIGILFIQLKYVEQKL